MFTHCENISLIVSVFFPNICCTFFDKNHHASYMKATFWFQTSICKYLSDVEYCLGKCCSPILTVGIVAIGVRIFAFVSRAYRKTGITPQLRYYIDVFDYFNHGPLTRYVRLRVAHAPEMPGTYSPPPRVSDPDMYHGMSGSLTSGFLWSWLREKRSHHSRRMRNPQFYISGKRPINRSSRLVAITAVITLGILSALPSHCNSVVPVDEISRYPMVQEISVTWLKGRVSGK